LAALPQAAESASREALQIAALQLVSAGAAAPPDLQAVLRTAADACSAVASSALLANEVAELDSWLLAAHTAVGGWLRQHGHSSDPSGAHTVACGLHVIGCMDCTVRLP
jgi:hypothetical protein